jgi:hypothetical protein
MADALITCSRRGIPLLEEDKKDRRNEPTFEPRAKTKPVKEAFVQTTETHSPHRRQKQSQERRN